MKENPGSNISARELPSESIQRQLASHLRDPENKIAPEGLEDRRVQIYRDLVYKNIFNFISSSFPVLKKVNSDAYWHELIRDFLKNYQAHSPYFSDLAREFLDYLEQRAQKQLKDDKVFMFELAQYEWAEVGLLLSDEKVPDNCFLQQIGDSDKLEDKLDELLADLESSFHIQDATPSLSPLAWSMHFSFPVHKISQDFIPDSPEAQPVFLIVYRTRDDRIHFMESNVITVRLLELCASGEHRVSELAAQLAAETGSEVESLRRSTARILLQLSARDIVGFKQ